MKKYDLEERTLKFSEQLVQKLNGLLDKKYSVVNRRLIDQLIRSGTSIGANYSEANECDTKKSFKNSIRIAKKEAKETVYWIKLLIVSLGADEDLEKMLDESSQLLKILASIYEKSK